MQFFTALALVWFLHYIVLLRGACFKIEMLSLRARSVSFMHQP